jgi:hypothetical protein
MEKYLDKYLKYKNKYLNLKKILVGGNEVKTNLSSSDKKIFIISSHHNRMVTMIFDFLQKMGLPIPRYIGDGLDPEIDRSDPSLPPNQQKFILDNCTTLKIIKEGDQVKISMLYPESRVKEESKSKTDIDGLNLHIIWPEYPDNLIVYLVRHGEGEHNIFDIKKSPYSTYSEEKIKELLLDPELTTKGDVQAIECAGKIFLDINKLYNESNVQIYFGCSYLKRTLQTVYMIRQIFIILNKLKCIIDDKIYVIPCIQEMIRPMMTKYQIVDKKKNQPLDKILVRLSLDPFESDISNYAPLYSKITPFDKKKVQYLIYENTPKCHDIENIVESCKTYLDCEVIWTHYIDVYRIIKEKNKSCADITVIKAICNFYDFLFRNEP